MMNLKKDGIFTDQRGYESMMRYHLFSSALSRAIDEGLIKEEDFYNDESFILNKIENVKDDKIQKVLGILKNKKLPDLRNKIGKKVIKKFRFIDPKVMVSGKPKKLSQLDPNFNRLLEKYRTINKKGLII